ncbi:hypothetical protein Hamer_G003153 [Homarus americanus]|uniref:Uncharacterized protein n=1 Tax=Homarus americanus TaxID=6706 RepID=A0A8J5JY30_HOMAM|nr:hypothetical protein Hamer_G026934 [Homarus americanus]KAG7174243.1 hypothetical protein Hamer_G003153 [Homarus americanus]
MAGPLVSGRRIPLYDRPCHNPCEVRDHQNFCTPDLLCMLSISARTRTMGSQGVTHLVRRSANPTSIDATLRNCDKRCQVRTKDGNCEVDYVCMGTP